MNAPDACLDTMSDRLRVLLRQESTSYQCCDYLKQPPQVVSVSNDSDTASSGSSLSELTSASSVGANEIWREKICKWTYEVVDHFDFNREIVSVSLSYLDRFLSTRQVNHKTFQLAAMTTLYLAIKLYEPRTLKISSLIELSRGYFRVEHIAAMEKFILRDLSWRVHPPTPQCMARHFFNFPPLSDTSLDMKVKQELMDLSHFFMELSVCDYFFVTRKRSSVALASIFNALDTVASSLPNGRSTFAIIRHDFIAYLNVIIPELEADLNCEIDECCIRLREMYHQAVNSQKPREEEMNCEERPEGRSPSCVSAQSFAEPPMQDDQKPRKMSKTAMRKSPGCGTDGKENYSST